MDYLKKCHLTNSGFNDIRIHCMESHHWLAVTAVK